MAGSGKQGSRDWRPQTRLVRGGLDRSPHRETAEALTGRTTVGSHGRKREKSRFCLWLPFFGPTR